MKAPSSKFLSITAIITALLAMLCSVVTARNYACLVTTPPRSPLHNDRHFHEPLDMISEMVRTPIYFNSIMKQSQVEVKAQLERSVPRYTVSEEAGMVLLEMEIPGVLAKDVEVDLEDNKLLRIKGRRTYKLHDGSVDKSEFDVAFKLKDDVDTSQLKADLVAGILRVQVPNKVKEVKRIRIGNDVTVDDAVIVSHNNVNDNETTSVTSSSLGGTVTSMEIVDGIVIGSETDA